MRTANPLSARSRRLWATRTTGKDSARKAPSSRCGFPDTVSPSCPRYFPIALRRTAIVVRGDNLADVLYRDASSRIKDFAPNPGRNISFLYRVSF
jgi:hypothetical protein